jgi:ketosteroid isomerase-like protein
MRAKFFLVLGLTTAATVGAADTGLVQNEYAFVQAVADHGIGAGFQAYLDPESIGFNPTPMKSYDNYKSRKPSSNKLSWYPSDALLAASGDFGFTTGPWTYQQNGAPQAEKGEFTTLWRLSKDGHWKALLDAGIDHDPPAVDPAALPKDASTRRLPKLPGKTDTVKARADLLEVDATFTRAAAGEGLRAAYATLAADSLRLLQENQQPAVGKDAALKAVPTEKASLVWIPAASDVASSGDLGYTYGVSYKAEDTAHAIPQASYLHIWQQDKSGWKLVLALESPVPPPPPAKSN